MCVHTFYVFIQVWYADLSNYYLLRNRTASTKFTHWIHVDWNLIDFCLQKEASGYDAVIGISVNVEKRRTRNFLTLTKMCVINMPPCVCTCRFDYLAKLFQIQIHETINNPNTMPVSLKMETYFEIFNIVLWRKFLIQLFRPRYNWEHHNTLRFYRI